MSTQPDRRPEPSRAGTRPACCCPTGEVMAFSGADRDEVAAPGSRSPVQQAELFDPKTGDWRPLASAHRPRTYHNTAALLPDGRVLSAATRRSRRST